MSKATKRKHVLIEVLQDDFSPPAENQEIVKVLCSRGNNLHEVQAPNGNTFLVSMPVKFRKNIWVKRGDFIIVEPIEEGDKVKAEMVRPLTAEHIKNFRKDGVWPNEFDNKQRNDPDELFENTNRLTVNDSESENSDSDSTSDSDKE